ncbi:MAG: carboxymuconolactone decarboxylase family protein [Pelagibacterales bacterium]|jgi:uncharacterized peroxidase-related enzyme|nr:carboxymuconolactone decarboxylase family protein [Pelagibacterales bacterium]
MHAEHKLLLAPISLKNADGEVKSVLEKAKEQVGFIPNMYEGMVNSPGLLNTYLDGYTAFRKNSGFSSIEQEVIFLTISKINGCSYCMAAHSFIADKKSMVPPEVIDAIRDGNEILDHKLAALNAFTTTMVVERGLPNKKDVKVFVDAGFSERQILEIILAISVKTISNYSNHLFHTPIDEMFVDHIWED